MHDDDDRAAEAPDPAEEVVAKLLGNKQLMEAIAKAREGLKPGQYLGDFLGEVIREEAPASDAAESRVVEHRLQRRKSLDELAKVIVAAPRASLAEIARESGIDEGEFEQLDSADPTQRTQTALRVADAIYASAPRTLGGTARLEQPAEVKERAAASQPPADIRGPTGTLRGQPRPAAREEPSEPADSPSANDQTPVAHDAAPSTEERVDAPGARSSDAPEAPELEPVVIPTQSRRGWLWLAAVGLAAAAVMLIVLTRSPDEPTEGSGAHHPPEPASAPLPVEPSPSGGQPAAPPPSPPPTPAPEVAPTPPPDVTPVAPVPAPVPKAPPTSLPMPQPPVPAPSPKPPNPWDEQPE